MSEPVEQAVGSENSSELSEPDDLASEEATSAPADAGAGSGADSKNESGNEELETLLAERTEDLQRVQAEYVNYKKRVDRDRAQAKKSGSESVLRSLMPVLDSIVAAKEHDELTGGFKLMADELAKVTSSYGLESFGTVGDEFDPYKYEALMQMPDPEATDMTVREVMQVGYCIGDTVIRPARVVVSVPAEEA